MRAQYDFSSFEDAVDRSAHPRLALAGGSDRPPPGQDESPAEVIRFPLERVRPAKDERQEPATDGDDDSPAEAEPAEAEPAETGALWAAWLTSVLSSGSTSLHPGTAPGG